MSTTPTFRRTSSILRFLAAILVVSASPVRAAVGVWSPLGPDGANVYALAVHPTNPRILYAGTEAWGVFKSTDGGSTWRPSNAGLGSGNPNVWIRSLVIDPRDPDTVYAASLGQGVFRSEDGGRSWAPASQGLPRVGADFQEIFSLVLDPRSPQTLYAGSRGGVFRSTDGGRTWKPRRSGLPENRVIHALALDPSTGVLWAGSDLGRLFRSADQGRSWRASGSGIPKFEAVLSLAISPEPSRLLAGTTGGIFRSTDSGRTWKRARSISADEVVEAVLFQGARRAYAGTSRSGVFRSDDGGATWAPATEGITDPVILSLAAGPRAVYAGTFAKLQPGGVFRSLDHGATWEPSQRGLSTVLVQEIAFDPVDPDVLYASAGQLGVFKSTDGGVSWSVLDLGLPPGSVIDISSLVIDPARPSRIYAACRVNGPLLRSDDGGATWQTFDNPLLIFEDLILDPDTPGALWAVGWGGLYRSEDEGATWTRQLLQPEEAFQLYDIQADPRDPRILYVSGAALFGARLAEARPRIFRSADGGQTWERRDAGFTDGQVIDLVLDPLDAATLYASANGTLYRSRDAGLSWNPLPGLQGITVLAIAPSSPPALYAAQDRAGVLRSIDQGETWTLIRRDLGAHRVLVLRSDPNDPERLFAGTVDGGIFTYRSGLGVL
jgi:photosystem II stability/assembly factor-like uncharacterized protein